MPTIKDVAREAGVSIATVSYVINGKDSSVSENTRRAVWEAIERIGYKPNVIARNLQANRSGLIGYPWYKLKPGQFNPLLDHFTYYTAQTAEALGYHILTFTHAPEDPETIYRDLIQTRRVDGFVLADTVRDDPRIRFLMELHFPFVAFGRSNPEWDFPWVDTDGHQGAFDAISYFIQHGHTRIAIAAWDQDSLAGEHRLQGYYDAFNMHGLPIDSRYVRRGDHSEASGRAAFHYFWGLKDRPTALFCLSDLVAIGVLNAAEERGVIIGRDLAVIGFDDVPMGNYLRPALASIRQPIPEISQTIIKMLQAVINGDRLPHRHVLIPPSLAIRASAGYQLRDL